MIRPDITLALGWRMAIDIEVCSVEANIIVLGITDIALESRDEWCGVRGVMVFRRVPEGGRPGRGCVSCRLTCKFNQVVETHHVPGLTCVEPCAQ